MVRLHGSGDPEVSGSWSVYVSDDAFYINVRGNHGSLVIQTKAGAKNRVQ